MAYINNIVVENARVLFRNFGGAPTKFNPGGKRTFSLVLDDETAEAAARDGWNVKVLANRDDPDDVTYHLPVEVSYRVKAPEVHMLSGGVDTLVGEETIGLLDSADIKSIDIVVTPYKWEMGGKSGVKAYLKTMYVVLEDSPFAAKYANYGKAANRIQSAMNQTSIYDEDDDLPF